LLAPVDVHSIVALRPTCISIRDASDATHVPELLIRIPDTLELPDVIIRHLFQAVHRPEKRLTSEAITLNVLNVQLLKVCIVNDAEPDNITRIVDLVLIHSVIIVNDVVCDIVNRVNLYGNTYVELCLLLPTACELKCELFPMDELIIVPMFEWLSDTIWVSITPH